MSENTTISVPKTLRDRVNLLAAQETRRTTKRIKQSDLIEKLVKQEEKKP